MPRASDAQTFGRYAGWLQQKQYRRETPLEETFEPVLFASTPGRGHQYHSKQPRDRIHSRLRSTKRMARRRRGPGLIKPHARVAKAMLEWHVDPPLWSGGMWEQAEAYEWASVALEIHSARDLPSRRVKVIVTL